MPTSGIHEVAYAHPKGAIIQKPGVGILVASLATTPTNGAAGYARGCLFINSAGNGTNTDTYINQGSSTSATWLNIG